MPSSSPPMVDLPVDILADSILIRLPVTSLLQCRSVSKQWKSLIDSHYFTTLHLNKFLNLKSNLNLIIKANSKFYIIDFPTLDTAIRFAFRNHLDPRPNVFNLTLIGSCNGLICSSENVVIFIWSPSLRKSRKVPNNYTHLSLVSNNQSSCAGIVYGFGFDPFSRDYKLVKIAYIIGARFNFESKVCLFSCKTNDWKTLPSLPYAICRLRTNGVFVDHALHWVVTRTPKPGDTNLIIAFDLRFDVFDEMPLPELGQGFEFNVGVLGGCLSMLVNYQDTRLDFWVMNQYGCKDSWVKLFTLVDLKSIQWKSLSLVRPLGYSSDGIKILFEHHGVGMFWYNLESEQVSYVTIPRITEFGAAMIWVGSYAQPSLPCENSSSSRKQKQHRLKCKNTIENSGSSRKRKQTQKQHRLKCKNTTGKRK